MTRKTTTIDVTAGCRQGPFVIQFADGALASGDAMSLALFTTYRRFKADEFAAELRSLYGPCRVRRATRIVVEL